MKYYNISALIYPNATFHYPSPFMNYIAENR